MRSRRDGAVAMIVLLFDRVPPHRRTRRSRVLREGCLFGAEVEPDGKVGEDSFRPRSGRYRARELGQDIGIRSRGERSGQELGGESVGEEDGSGRHERSLESSAFRPDQPNRPYDDDGES